MKNRGNVSGAIASQAAAWLARRDAGMSAAEQAAFIRWREADPRHAVAVSEIETVWGALDRPAATGQDKSLRAALAELARRQRRRRLAIGTFATLAAASFALALWSPRVSPIAPSPHLTAQVSQPERQVLPDGSVIELKAGAEVDWTFSQAARTAVLRGGEAHFSVAKDPDRPFVVEAGTVKVRAVGTAFAVQLNTANVEVLVTAGAVSVDAPPLLAAEPAGAGADSAEPLPPPAPAPILGAGYRATIFLNAGPAAPKVETIPPEELAERLAWRLPRLDFSETTIAEAVALFNRHNAQQLRAGDRAVAAMRVTGVFRSDNIEGFVRALEASLGVHTERLGSEIVLFGGNESELLGEN